MTRSTLTSVVLLTVGLTLVQAQSLSLSQACQNTLLEIAANPEADCLNVQGLAPLITAPANTSLVAPINSWLEGLCAQAPCSNQAISDIVTNISTGCATDLTSAGLNESTSTLVAEAQQAFPIIRDVGCLKTTSNNTLCVTTILTQLQTANGILSLSSIVGDVPSAMAGAGASTNVPTYVTCSDCVKAAYNILNQDDQSLASSASESLQSTCGSSFTDGSSPADVAEGTGTAAPNGSAISSTSAAMLTLPRNAAIGVILTTLITFVTAVVLLA